MRKVLEALLKELENGRVCELATILRVEGTAPREPGCTMLIGEDGTPLAGTVGGGSTEYHALETAAALLKNGENGEAVFTHGADIPSCRTEVTVRFTCCRPGDGLLIAALREALSRKEGTLRLLSAGGARFLPGVRPERPDGVEGTDLYLPSAERVVIFGAGHVAQALCPLLKTLGFSVTVYDERAELADSLHFSAADRVLAGPFSADIVKATGAGPEDCIVIMSATHATDEQILSRFTDRAYRYIGMLGSGKKAAAIRDSLMKKGVPEARLKNIHIPIGLDIGARTPEEVALSVAAELVGIRAGTFTR